MAAALGYARHLLDVDVDQLPGALALVAHARDGAAGAQLARDAVDVVQTRQPLRATILAQVRAGTPVSADSASGASSSLVLASATRASASGGVSLASRRGRQPLSVMGSPRRARASHLWAVWRLTPAIAAASAMRMPPPTRSQSSALPLGVSLALGCWDMGGPSSLCA